VSELYLCIFPTKLKEMNKFTFGCGCKNIIRAKKLVNLALIQRRSLSNQNYHHTTKPNKNVDPFKLTKDGISNLHQDICTELDTQIPGLRGAAHYYFDGKGKLFRPMAVILAGYASNFHLTGQSDLINGQKRVAMIAEMIHTASLLHDDVIDEATERRNKPSVNHAFSQKEAILAGDFVLSRSSILLAQLGNTKAVELFSYIINDLVKGELMQLFTKDDLNERFNHYLLKTYRKTASLIAYSCQSISLLGGCDDRIQEAMYNYGKNIGIAFQLVDDALDFISTSEILGKPAGADLSLGLATAPILFAAEKYPDLHGLIGRRFKLKGDVEQAFDLVHKSDGVAETYSLARKYVNQATKDIRFLKDSVHKEALFEIGEMVVSRDR